MNGIRMSTGAPTTTGPLLELQRARAAYGDIEVLHGVDFSVAPGQIVAVLGPNGAGKSTMLKVAAGMLRPTAGRLVLSGRDVTGVSANALARVGVCTVPEGRGIFPNLTVRENLLMATYTVGPAWTPGSFRSPASRPTPTRTVLRTIEERSFTRFPRLAERRGQLAGTLSGGEQQMLSLARALATDPIVLLLDELSMGLAPLVVADLYETVAAIAADGVGVMVVEQFAHTALHVADDVVVVAGGRVRFAGGASSLDADTLAAVYLGHAGHDAGQGSNADATDNASRPAVAGTSPVPASVAVDAASPSNDSRHHHTNRSPNAVETSDDH